VPAPTEPSAAWPAVQALTEKVRESKDATAVYEAGALFAQLTRVEYAKAVDALTKTKGLGLRIRQLEDIVKEARRHRGRSWGEGSIPYRATDEGMVWDRAAGGEVFPTPLTNFSASITREIVKDDGVEEQRLFEIEAVRNGQKRPITVPAGKFSQMGWVTDQLGSTFVVNAGQGLRDHARTAIQLLSGEAPEEHVYAHTGWRNVEDEWFYLHAGGAIGGSGPVPDVHVEFDGPLRHYELPEPPEAEELVKAIRASLALLDVAPDRITIPLLATAYRAAVGGETNFSMHVAGSTGVGKTQLAAIDQQHFGPGMDAQHLPGSWTSTANSLEALASAAKDTILTVDDFAPTGTTYDVQKMHRDADRLFRAQGNASGRGRMRPDSSLRPVRAPRGVIISTGEDVPQGESLRARFLVTELGPDDVDWEEFTRAQQNAAGGVYAKAMAGFVQWLAPQYAELHKGLANELAELRQRVSQKESHRRTATITAELMIGWRCLLRFGREVGALSGKEVSELEERGWSALAEASSAQWRFQAAAEPAGRFIELLGSAIASGQAHVAWVNGKAPPEPSVWGWRTVERGSGQHQTSERQPQGRRVGWMESDEVYLDRDAAFAVAQAIGNGTGCPLTVTPQTLAKRLHERGLLASIDKRGGKTRYRVRQTIEGRRCGVLHLKAEVFGVAPVGHSMGHLLVNPPASGPPGGPPQL